MRNDEMVVDVFFVLGLGGMGAGVFFEFGPGWALVVVGFILLALSLLGSMNRDA